MIAGGGADVIVDWMPAALAAREKGVPLVNIAQPFKKSGLELTCRKETGITKPADFKGKTLGVWFFGNEYPFFAWMNKLGLTTDGGADGVTVLKQGFNVEPADPEAGRLHLDHDLQRILAGHRRRHSSRTSSSSSNTRTRASPRSRTASTSWRTSSRTRPSSTRWSASSRPR